jgi:hypothetical protein
VRDPSGLDSLSESQIRVGEGGGQRRRSRWWRRPEAVRDRRCPSRRRAGRPITADGDGGAQKLS